MNVRRIAKDFPVVCVAGSAGGLDAYARWLTKTYGRKTKNE